MKRFLFIFIIILICFLYSNKNVQAQASNVEPVDQIISVEIIPSSPKSFQGVSVEISSYSYDLSRSKIDWYINGALKTSGVGKKLFNFTTGDIGSVSKIKYQIQTPEGVVFEKSVTISPADVTLLWESSGYTPPFYKGKSLFSFEGSLRLIAIPNLINTNGVKYKPSELVYTWKRGLGTDTDASGYGKNIFFWNGSIVSNNEEIEVEVSDINNTVRATASVIVSPNEAEILAYADDPALGILFNKTIKNTFDLIGSEASFVAIPYYFNNPDSDGEYSWFVNGQKSPESSRYITFRNTTGVEGYSKISFDLTSQKRILQSANSSFDINFGAKKTSAVENIFKNFFGN
jgi:hypothetical protein